MLISIYFSFYMFNEITCYICYNCYTLMGCPCVILHTQNL